MFVLQSFPRNVERHRKILNTVSKQADNEKTSRMTGNEIVLGLDESDGATTTVEDASSTNLESIAADLCRDAAIRWYKCKKEFKYGGINYDECKVEDGKAKHVKIYVQVRTN